MVVGPSSVWVALTICTALKR